MNPSPVGRAPVSGLLFAGVTALVSGVSVFVNSYGVHSFSNAAVYTTAKNLVAAFVLVAVAAVLHARRSGVPGPSRPHGRELRHSGLLRWLAFAYVGVIGGGVAFILFFEGLARTTATPAAFLHDTMLVWVAVLAWAFLRERPSLWNVGAIALLMAGQVVVTGGIGHFVVGQGQLLVLEATLLWAVETVVAKRLLQSIEPSMLAVVRMGTGVVVLLGFLLATGRLGMLTGLNARQAGWALLTGGLLAAYVATWMVALSRARAVDVTSVLAASVVVTSLLQLGAGHPGSVPEAIGLGLVVLGTATVLRAWPRPAVSR